MALGGKDGYPFPVPLKVYDTTIRVLKDAIGQAKLGNADRLAALQRLDDQARTLERIASGPDFDSHIAEEKRRAPAYGGKTV